MDDADGPKTPLCARIGPVGPPVIPTHPDVAVWRAPTVADIDALHGLLAAASAVDHPTWTVPREEVAEIFEMAHIDPSRDGLLGFAADGRLVVNVAAHMQASREVRAKSVLAGAVHPDVRRRGIGTAALPWAFDRARGQLATVSHAVPGEIAMYVEERTTDAVAVAERLGLRTERWFTTMERPLEASVPERVRPAGFHSLAVGPELTLSLLAARNDAFRDHWGSLPQVEQTWRAFIDGPYFRAELSAVIADDTGEVAGFCLVSVNEDDFDALGASHIYIDLIGVVRGARGRGVAQAVIAETLQRARAAGLERAVLDVDTESPTGALGLYERLGFVATDRSRVLTRRW